VNGHLAGQPSAAAHQELLHGGHSRAQRGDVAYCNGAVTGLVAAVRAGCHRKVGT
jgi:hypothetical protein